MARDEGEGYTPKFVKSQCVTKVNIEQVASVFKPSQIHPSATAEAVETAVELGKWFHISFQNTVGAPALVKDFKTERSNMILLPRPCVKEAADLISHETRAHVSLGAFTGAGSQNRWNRSGEVRVAAGRVAGAQVGLKVVLTCLCRVSVNAHVFRT